MLWKFYFSLGVWLNSAKIKIYYTENVRRSSWKIRQIFKGSVGGVVHARGGRGSQGPQAREPAILQVTPPL